MSQIPPPADANLRVEPGDAPGRLDEHLREWLGVWPPPANGLTVVGSDQRDLPSWDGTIRPVAGVETVTGAVLSVSPMLVGAVRALGDDLDEIADGLGEALGRPSWRFGRGIFRWSTEPAPSDDPGTWLPTSDPRVLPWLRPFNGEVLVGFTASGEAAAGVGRKFHNDAGHELAVVTDEDHRGEGWARRLVSQAARRVLDDGAIPTYLHAEDNVASAKTADAAGFPDHGWRVLGLFPGAPG
jgi:GNAT superfamily N-acetyltransferase